MIRATLLACCVAAGLTSASATVLQCSEKTLHPPGKSSLADHVCPVPLDSSACIASPEVPAASEPNHKQTIAILSGACLGLFALRRARLR